MGVPDTDTETNMAVTDTLMEQISYLGKPLSTPISCKKCPKKNITIQRLQKNNSHLKRTVQALPEHLKMVRMKKDYVVLYNVGSIKLTSKMLTIFLHLQSCNHGDQTEASADEQYEDNRMERNAWRVAQDVASRIDDAPVLSSYIKSFATEKGDDTFFFNKEQLQEFAKASESQRQDLTGYHYFSKITKYIDSHYATGELYMEFLKDSCKGKSAKPCSTCTSGWIGPEMGRIPRPFPDGTTFKYKSVFESPENSSEGVPRTPDDFMPRAQIKILFAQGKLDSEEDFEEFSKKFIVPTELVKSYIEHLRHLRYTKQLRSTAAEQQRQRKKEKKYEEYNWEELLLTG